MSEFRRRLMERGPQYIVTWESHLALMLALYRCGLCKRQTYMTRAEAAAVTTDEFNASNFAAHFWDTGGTTFDEFQWFTGVTELRSWTGWIFSQTVTRLTLPPSIVSLQGHCINIVEGGEIILLTATPPQVWESTFAPMRPCTWYVPNGSLGLYKTTRWWMDQNIKEHKDLER